MSKQDLQQNWAQQITSDDDQRLVDLSQLALQEAKRLGADESEASVGLGSGLSVNVRQGEVETVENHNGKSLTINVYLKKRNGSASTTDFSEAAIKQAVAAACHIAEHTEADPCSGLADEALMAQEIVDFDGFHPWDITTAEAIEMAQACEAAGIACDKRINNSDGSAVNSGTSTSIYTNSHGFLGVSRNSSHSVSATLIAQQGDEMQRDYWYDSVSDARELKPVEHIGVEAARRTTRRLGGRKIDTGNFPVIYEQPLAAGIWSHFISAISGGSVYRDATFLKDKVGEQIFPKWLSVEEQPHIHRGPGSSSFDGEGVATQPRHLIRDGVLQGYVLSSYSARKLELQTTGNAGGVRNIRLPQSDVNLEQLIKQMGTGVLLTELIGRSINGVTGDYSRGAFGFWVENGEIAYPVEEFTVAGNLQNMFAGLQAMANDIDPHKNTHTGSLLIDAMTFAGQ